MTPLPLEREKRWQVILGCALTGTFFAMLLIYGWTT